MDWSQPGERGTPIKLPDERNGLLMVFRPFEHLSYALILEINDIVQGRRPASPTRGKAQRRRWSARSWPAGSDWSLTPGIGNSTARRLLAAFGLPEAVFGQSAAALRQFLTEPQIKSLHSEPPPLAAQLDASWHWLQATTDRDGAAS